MKKPLPVKIVEALGWTYVVLVVLGCAVGIWKSGDPSLFIAAVFPLALTLGMVLQLRRGRRAWFLWPNTLVWGLVGISMLGAIPYGRMGAVLLEGLLLLAFMVAPIVLLHLRPANQWCSEKLGGKAEPKGCAAVFCTTIIVLSLVFMPEIMYDWNSSPQRDAIKRSCALLELVAGNKTAREAGDNWVDPAAFSNSTQFVQALCEKYKDDKGGRSCNLGPYTNIWCIAVNPPDDKGFPVLFTANIDPRELLSQSGGDRKLTLTCPKEWGGNCFKFCEKAAVIVCVGGATQIVKSKYSSPNRIFLNGIPNPGPNTYFLTSTGRVDIVERQVQSVPGNAKTL